MFSKVMEIRNHLCCSTKQQSVETDTTVIHVLIRMAHMGGSVCKGNRKECWGQCIQLCAKKRKFMCEQKICFIISSYLKQSFLISDLTAWWKRAARKHRAVLVGNVAVTVYINTVYWTQGESSLNNLLKYLWPLIQSVNCKTLLPPDVLEKNV